MPTTVYLVKAMVFPVVMYGGELDHKESWALKNWHFWTVMLGKTLESHLDCKEVQPVHLKGNQSWIFIYGLMLKLKLQSFGHLMWRTESFEKTLMLEKIEGRRRGDDRGWDGWTASLTQWRSVWVNCGRWWWIGRPGMRPFMGSQRVEHHWMTELKWTEVVQVMFSFLNGYWWFMYWMASSEFSSTLV